jgi:hypothetical protein
MTTHILRGSKQEIAERLTLISGEVREAIVFVEEATRPAAGVAPDANDIFVEMQPFMVNVSGMVDDSRAAIYTPVDTE